MDTLSDGHLELPFDFSFAGLPRDQLDPILQQAGVSGDMIQSPCNITLLRDGTNTVLFDAGSGPDFMPTAGKVTEALAALELTPRMSPTCCSPTATLITCGAFWTSSTSRCFPTPPM